MQISGNSCREIANTYSVVIVREGGRSYPGFGGFSLRKRSRSSCTE